MRRSPRRPLILRRRKLPFQQSEPPAADPRRAPGSPPCRRLPDGVRVLDHPCTSDTKVLVIPDTAAVEEVIQALGASGGESGPSKFIILGGSAAAAGEEAPAGSPARQPSKEPVRALRTLNGDLECRPLDDSLASIQSLKEASGCAGAALPRPAEQTPGPEKENWRPQQEEKAEADAPPAERPPYSYMALIQFAINSQRNRRLTLKEIYTWIEERFPYFRQVAKPGWKNSIRHNLSLHDMFTRETSADGKVSYWTIRPEANRRITLDQVCKADAGPAAAPAPVQTLLLSQQQQKRAGPEQRKTPGGSEKRMKPLLPRADCYLVPVQLPVASPVFLPASGAPFPRSSCQQRTSRGAKRVRIAPKATQGRVPSAEAKEEPASVPAKRQSPDRLPQRAARSSRRKQRLVQSRQEEPVLLCPQNTACDSGCGEAEPRAKLGLGELSFETPVKASAPSGPPAEDPAQPWRVTPLGKGSRSALDLSPVRTPQRGCPGFGFSSTPFKELPLFGSPRELLASPPGRAGEGKEAPQAGGNQSLTEGLMLDLLNDSLSRILVDASFPGLEDEDVNMANISWSELLPQLK